jgi:hypothetical protein
MFQVSRPIMNLSGHPRFYKARVEEITVASLKNKVFISTGERLLAD